MITNPVVAYFAAAPVTACELGETFCTGLFRSNGTDVEGHLRNFFGVCGAGTADDRKASCPGQICFQRLERVNAYRTLVKASVCDVGLFGVGKRGVPFFAVRSAA